VVAVVAVAPLAAAATVATVSPQFTFWMLRSSAQAAARV
jgi:hypothetical protein